MERRSAIQTTNAFENSTRFASYKTSRFTSDNAQWVHTFSTNIVDNVKIYLHERLMITIFEVFIFPGQYT